MPKSPRYHSLLGFVPEPGEEPPPALPPEPDPMQPKPPRIYCRECDGLDGFHDEECSHALRGPVKPDAPISKPKTGNAKSRLRATAAGLLRALADRLGSSE